MEAPRVDQSYDQECRRRNKLVTQDHEGNRHTDRLTDRDALRADDPPRTVQGGVQPLKEEEEDAMP